MSKTSVMLTGALLALSACAIEAQSNYSVTFPVGAKADNTMAYLCLLYTSDAADEY